MTIVEVQPASSVPVGRSSRTYPSIEIESLNSCAMSVSAYAEVLSTMPPESPLVTFVHVIHPAPLRNLRSKHWVKVQGLPFTTTIEDLTRFFGSFRLSSADNIILVIYNGRATGRAFVELADPEEAKRACEELAHRDFDSHRLELRIATCRAVLQHLRTVARAQENGSTLPVGVDKKLRTPTAFLPLPRTGNCLKLVGLRYDCTNEDITTFLQPYQVRPGGIHFCSRKGRAIGKCVVEMIDAIEVIKAVRTLHRKYLGDRYVEVYPARPCDIYCNSEDLKTALHVRLPSCYNPRMLCSYMVPYRAIEDHTVVVGGYSTPEVHVVLSFPDQDIAHAAQQYLCETLLDVLSVEIMTEGDRLQFSQVSPAGFAGQSAEPIYPFMDGDSDKKPNAHNNRFVHQPYSLDQFIDPDYLEDSMNTTTTMMMSEGASVGKFEPPRRSQLLHALIKSVSHA